MIMDSGKNGKVLKSCIRCRKHKTKCDAFARNPLPCTNCDKRKASCKFEVVQFKSKKNSNDVINALTKEITWLNDMIDNMIYNKSILIKNLSNLNPSILEIQSVLNDSSCNESPLSLDCTPSEFNIRSDTNYPLVAFSVTEASQLFSNFHHHFHRFLPILPDDFYSADISELYKENDLLFWCIILTSLLNSSERALKYLYLSKHIKSLVVKTCWLSTPRSVYVLVSLLILTTWPIPPEKDEKINDNVSIKYLSLLKSLSMQLGLHRLEFIDEFSHKTNLNLSNVNLNNSIRERIYKYVTINSNYWLVNLGLLNLNFNGFQQDYILNKSNNENQNTADNSKEDKYINSLLKISIIQQRLNENLNENTNEELNKDFSNNVSNHFQSKLINLNMFEVILEDLNGEKSTVVKSNLIRMSIEYSKLQLYLYTLDGQLNLPIGEYKSFVYKVLHSCFNIIELFKEEFNDIYSVNQLPIHYKFIIELVSLLLMKIFYSPLLNSISDYEKVKENFTYVFKIIMKNHSKWKFCNDKFTKVLIKFDQLLSKNLLKYLNFINSYYILNKFNNYQISNVNYELIWSIYTLKNNETTDFGWDKFGIQDEKLVQYLDNISLL